MVYFRFKISGSSTKAMRWETPYEADHNYFDCVGRKRAKRSIVHRRHHHRYEKNVQKYSLQTNEKLEAQDSAAQSDLLFFCSLSLSLTLSKKTQ